MSGRQAKERRALAYHAEYGSYIPAMLKSRDQLNQHTPRHIRRAKALAERKVKKVTERTARQDAAWEREEAWQSGRRT